MDANKLPQTANEFSGSDRSLTVRQLLIKHGLTKALNDNITELAINEPNGYWTEGVNGWQYYENENLTYANLQGLARAISVYNRKPLDVDNPIGSMILPDGQRIQIVLPPVCEQGKISITIRNPSTSRFSLNDYNNSGRLKPSLTKITDTLAPWQEQLIELQKQGDFAKFFELAIEHHLNIVTVGGTGSGKTTFSKTLIDLYPKEKRIFTIEDAHELTTPYHKNCVHMFFSPAISAKDVLASTMRMKPDHIFITELRGDESWDYLMALKSGHSGSVTSIHANDCRGALYKIGSYIKQSEVGRTLDFDYIMREVYTTIDVVVYFDKTYLTELYYDPALKIQKLMGN